MNLKIIILSLYCVFSLLVAVYAFKHFRKMKCSMTFSVVGSFILLFVWFIPALRWIKQKYFDANKKTKKENKI